jgi:hypothetical protein
MQLLDGYIAREARLADEATVAIPPEAISS